jgi:hypothetical protein
MLGMHCEQQLQQHVWDQLYLQQTMPYETIIADYMKCLQGNRELEVCDVCITVKSEVQHQACQYDDVPCPMSCTTSSAMQAVQLHRVWRSSKAACNGHCCWLPTLLLHVHRLLPSFLQGSSWSHEQGSG